MWSTLATEWFKQFLDLETFLTINIWETLIEKEFEEKLYRCNLEINDGRFFTQRASPAILFPNPCLKTYHCRKAYLENSRYFFGICSVDVCLCDRSDME